MRRRTLEDCHRLAATKGGRCLSPEYRNNRTPLLWRCQDGHEWQACLYSIQAGTWCPACVGLQKLTIAVPRAIAEARGGRCLSESYENGAAHLLWECALGHRWKASLENVKNQESWCPTCPTKRSAAELELFRLVKRLHPDAVSGARGVLPGTLELDIYVPSLRAAVEYDGKYWHSLEVVKARDEKKNGFCQDIGIRLLRVKEADYKQDPNGSQIKVLSFLVEPANDNATALSEAA